MKPKKLLSLLVALFMAMPLIAVSASKEPDYFYIKNTGSGAVALIWDGAALRYSRGDTASFTDFSGELTLSPGEQCFFKGNNETAGGIRENGVSGGSIAVGGNIATLLTEDGDSDRYPERAFAELFSGLSVLKDVTDLTLCRKDTVLGAHCFDGTFFGCDDLSEVPERFLPATTLAEGCYQLMFSTQDAITAAPALPAAELCKDCYRGMFGECLNLSSVKVGFTAWGDDKTYATFNFLPDSASGTVTVYCPKELDCEQRDRYSIPKGLSVIVKTPITVSFDMQGHGGTRAPIIAYTDDPVKKPKTPTEKGYTFAGWYKEKACVNPWDFETDTSETDMTLYAKWLSYEASLVNFYRMEGEGGTEYVFAQYGQPMPGITLPFREGYFFAGYYDADGVRYYNGAGASARNWDKKDVETSLFADWVRTASAGDITVESGETLELNGGERSADTVLVKVDGKIRDSSGGMGILKMAKNTLYGRNYTDQFPLYDAAAGGWRFFDCEISAGYIEGDTGIIGTTLTFKNAEAAKIAKRILASDYSGLTLDITISEQDENGAVHKTICEVPQSVLKAYAADLTKPILMRVSDITKNMDISVNYRFINGLAVSTIVPDASPYITLEAGAEGSYTVKVYGTGLSGTVIVAVYNSEEEKTLVDVTLKKVAEISDTAPEGGGFVSAMLWSDPYSMKPLCEAVSGRIGE